MERKVELEVQPTGWVGMIGRFWCRQFHRSVMWPIHGEYKCSACGRRYCVPWDVRNSIPARPRLRVVTKHWPQRPVPKPIVTALRSTGSSRFISLSVGGGEDAA